jgi:hypothetical protein
MFGSCNSPYVKVELVDDDSEIRNHPINRVEDIETYQFSSLDEMMIAEILTSNLELELFDLTKCITDFKNKYNHFGYGFPAESYEKNKKLIINLINYENKEERDELNEKFVNIKFFNLDYSRSLRLG